MKKIIHFSLAVGFSFMLFLLMSTLIKDDVKVAVSKPSTVIDFALNIKDIPVEPIKRKSKKPPELETIIKKPNITKSKPLREKIKPIKMALSPDSIKGFKSSLKADIPIGGMFRQDLDGNGDSAHTPQFRIEPLYPRNAALNNIEGYVTLSFDINEQGKPINIEIIEAKPRGYFEQNARKALRKWKYLPKKESGKAVVVIEERVTLAFQLESI